MLTRLAEPPYPDHLVSEIVELSEAAFGNKAPDEWVSALKWRIHNMPDFTVFITEEGGQLTGFKAGYAAAYDRYYSWLGAVHPDFQRQGVARSLMQYQHDWLAVSRFAMVSTHVAQSNNAMIAANLEFGLQKAGMFSKKGEPYLILEKYFGST